jgi:heme/copper-type cytochrome/quinol oxidase subunit 2
MFASLISVVVFLVIGSPGAAGPLSGQGASRHFTIVGSNCTFRPASIAVDRNDLVHVTFTAEDMPHSFTIDEYRISKRAGVGQSVTVEFLADRAGRFDYYCSLTGHHKCETMRGALIVK